MPESYATAQEYMTLKSGLDNLFSNLKSKMLLLRKRILDVIANCGYI